MDLLLPAFLLQNPNRNPAFYSRLYPLWLRLVPHHGNIVIWQILQDYSEAVWCPRGGGRGIAMETRVGSAGS